jgi:hypothetical protein
MALTVREYLAADGECPFREWLFVDEDSRSADSQAKDITRARGFWRDYLEAQKHGKAT